jgi:hypothetical protein
MTSGKFILVDEDFQNKVLIQLSELRSMLKAHKITMVSVKDDELMDGVDVEKYLKCSRHTIYVMRKNGLPFIRKEDRRVYYWKSQIDKYLEKPQSYSND